ncbi:MAG TPA: TatD family hydrolase [Cytophagaceae bacterium]|jgi:TatD DNase family protein|nr:TatD family hydrolase [Cytophagaceae bacterium]
MYIDTHAHIYDEEFKENRASMIEKAYETGIHKIYMPNVDHTSIDGMMELETKYQNQCIAMMGLHPCYVKRDFEKELYLIEDWLAKRHFSAIGEIGMDFYWDISFKEQQEEALKIQLAWAEKYSLPVILHCRNSFRETMDIIKSVKTDQLHGIFHCFSGTKQEAEEVASIGFKIGIGGVITFKNSGLDKIIPEINLEHIVLETDSPYLAPVPFRGKRNEPAYIPIIAKKIAELKNISVEEVAEITTANAMRLFK